MKAKHPLFQLKNSPAGEQKFQQLMEGSDPSAWIKEFLETNDIPNGREAWKDLLLKWEDTLLLYASQRSPLMRKKSLSILLQSDSIKTGRLLWEALSDSDAGVRALVVKEFQSDDRQKLYNILYRIFLTDPVWDVRKAARNRLKKDFSDLFSINPDHLDRIEKVHCIELLEKGSAMDHDLAYRFLLENEPGISLNASLYLEKEGCLDKLIRQADLSDMEDFQRRLTLLRASAECKISSFMDKSENFQTPGALCIGMELIATGTYSSISEKLIDATMAIKKTTPYIRSVQLMAVKNLLRLTSQESFALIHKIFQDYRHDNEILTLILRNIPVESASQLYSDLIGFLKDKEFSPSEELILSFKRFPLSFCIRDMFQIVRDLSLHPAIRKRALAVLCHHNEKSTILFILENLPVFTKEEINTLGEGASKWSKEEFLTLSDYFLKHPDTSVKNSLITLHSHAGITDFVPQMEEILSDSDPLSRITAVESLARLNQLASLSKIVPLLHDPEEDVRAATAAALINWKREETFLELKEILFDKNETTEVAATIISAWGVSQEITAISMLVPLIELKPSLEELIHHSLLNKGNPEEIEEILKYFKTGTPALRQSLTRFFTKAGEAFEKPLMGILENQDEIALHQSVSEILDETGYVDLCINMLRNRKKDIRKKAAQDLILINTRKAWGGLVLAVKDINREIRILAIRAMEKLKNSDSQKILQDLLEDPDKKVKKFTQWALEKIEAGKLP